MNNGMCKNIIIFLFFSASHVLVGMELKKEQYVYVKTTRDTIPIPYIMAAQLGEIGPILLFLNGKDDYGYGSCGNPIDVSDIIFKNSVTGQFEHISAEILEYFMKVRTDGHNFFLSLNEFEQAAFIGTAYALGARNIISLIELYLGKKVFDNYALDVTHINFNRDGTLVVTESFNNKSLSVEYKIWNVKSGKKLSTVRTEWPKEAYSFESVINASEGICIVKIGVGDKEYSIRHKISDLSYSGNLVIFNFCTKRVLICEHDTMVLRDVETGESTNLFLERTATKWWNSDVKKIEFSRSGRYIVIMLASGLCAIWDTQTKMVKILREKECCIRNVVFNANETKIALGLCNKGKNWAKCEIWDVEGAKKICSSYFPTWATIMMAFSPDDKQIATVLDGGKVILWTIKQG